MRNFVVGGLLLLWLTGTAVAAESPNWELGLRGGMEATGTLEQYDAGEIYLLRTLPWHNELAGGVLTARFDLGLGYLESDHDGGCWLAGGADLVYSLAGGLIDLEAGFRPTWLMDHIYGSDDFGGDLQFTSHGGIALYLDPVAISYRYQHISNASIYKDNDGLDLHLFGIGARF